MQSQIISSPRRARRGRCGSWLRRLVRPRVFASWKCLRWRPTLARDRLNIQETNDGYMNLSI